MVQGEILSSNRVMYSIFNANIIGIISKPMQNCKALYFIIIAMVETMIKDIL